MIIRKLVYLLMPISLTACSKNFLDKKSDQSQRVPAHVSEYAALLDNKNMNVNGLNLNACGSDEYFITEAQYNSFPTGITTLYERMAYDWEGDMSLAGEQAGVDWKDNYNRIMQCNLVLEGLDNLNNVDDQQEFDRAKGTALFIRSLNFFHLAEQYCLTPTVSEMEQALGIPLKLEVNFDRQVSRATLKKTYAQIIDDLTAAILLLPVSSNHTTRPGKAAAHALLAKVYLILNEFDKVEMHAAEAIKINPYLLDLNKTENVNTQPFPSLYENREILFHGQLIELTMPGMMDLDPELAALYKDDDLRPDHYFKNDGNNRVSLFGTYAGFNDFSRPILFSGLAVDEVYLLHAEACARQSKLTTALESLNFLRKHRIDRSKYIALSSTNKDEVLVWVLEERRRELVLRGNRWGDIKRLNREPRYAKTLVRNNGAVQRTLPPGDLRFAWPLHEYAIIYDKLEQNPR
ncbi:SusD-like starch-binding protein associating with outer membrane [Pseudobacter ginsenosidimutans]|uniref:SusD-like starch-binding protein associating with outer membrane n=2 Tax=Pseudobacter ginsenosidimutans TaxID=661488 RepID=A0A4Q7MLA9_9BACT|nr:SusD-like starch-binding protein associating with outer membrane [Pseudobacter ginsenosidimutans]